MLYIHIACILSKPEILDNIWNNDAAFNVDTVRIDSTGVLLTLLASGISGFSGAWSQRVLSGASANSTPRHSMLYSMELAVYGIITLSISELYEYYTHRRGLFVDPGSLTHRWTYLTWIPVLLNVSV